MSNTVHHLLVSVVGCCSFNLASVFDSAFKWLQKIHIQYVCMGIDASRNTVVWSEVDKELFEYTHKVRGREKREREQDKRADR